MGFTHHVMENPPLKVEFAGLRGTTHSMQSMGWQLAIDEGIDEYRNSYMLRLAGKHPGMDLKVMSKAIFLDDFHRMFMDSHNPMIFEQFPPIPLYICARSIQFQVMETHLPSFYPVDARPAFAEREIKNLDDMYIFKRLNEDTEIVVPEQTVPELLELILAKQMPEQKEIRERERRRERERSRQSMQGTHVDSLFDQYNPAKDIKIQVVSLRQGAA